MRYSTHFEGQFDITPTLTVKDKEFLTKLAGTRRVKRAGLDPKFGEDIEDRGVIVVKKNKVFTRDAMPIEFGPGQEVK